MDNRDIVIQAAHRLLPCDDAIAKIKTLPVQQARGSFQGWTTMPLPDWAQDIVPDQRAGLLVPLWSDMMGVEWEDYDWWRAAHDLMTNVWERRFEQKNQPCHSYAYRLGEDQQLLFDHAWVNRIILFLRRWYAHKNNADETDIFGVLPAPILHLTHDVDAVSKTLPIRLKQTAFCLYNRRFAKAFRFMFGIADYWQFETILAMEKASGRTSLWNVYGGIGGWWRSIKKNIMDPSYKIQQPRLYKQFQKMAAAGHEIGLHQAYDSWNNADDMRVEKERIETALGMPITQCRQHWLRFSFAQTWYAQKQAGLECDMTLGFNDRPGFRNSAAFSFVDIKSGMQIVPMVLMDSHLYDYADLTQEQRIETMDHILRELKETGGEASAIWHHRVFHPDYGWGEGYQSLLNKMDAMGFEK